MAGSRLETMGSIFLLDLGPYLGWNIEGEALWFDIYNTRGCQLPKALLEIWQSQSSHPGLLPPLGSG